MMLSSKRMYFYYFLNKTVVFKDRYFCYQTSARDYEPAAPIGYIIGKKRNKKGCFSLSSVCSELLLVNEE